MFRWICSFLIVGALGILGWITLASPDFAAIAWGSAGTIGLIVLGCVVVGFLATIFAPVIEWMFGILLLGALGLVAWQLALEPGRLELDWGGHRITTTVALTFWLTAACVLVLAVVFRIYTAIRRTPLAVGRWSQSSRQRAGLQALSQGLVAIAAGDAETAQAKAAVVRDKLDDPPLAMLISAQAAQMRGDEQAAETFFTQLKERQATEFLGTRGLLLQAMKQEKWDEALALAKGAYRLDPKSKWVVSTLYDLQKRTGRWADAEFTLTKSVAKLGLMTPAEVKAERAEIHYHWSLGTTGDEAIREAKKALTDEPAMGAAALRLAQLRIARGEQRDAIKVIERAWAHNPDADLAAVYWDARSADTAETKLDAARRLAERNPDHAESHIAVAATAIEAEAWGEARQALAPLITGSRVPPRVCLLMVDLEEKEHGDLAGARKWVSRAAGGEGGATTEPSGAPPAKPRPAEPEVHSAAAAS